MEGTASMKLKRSDFLIVKRRQSEGWVVEVRMLDGSDRAWSCGGYSLDDALDRAFRAAEKDLKQPIMEG